MRSFAGKVAVVTGGASGIGRAMACALAAEGMKVVVADVEDAARDAAVEELRSSGHDATGVRTDVTRPESVDELARAALDAYGKVHIVCNNAGVAGGVVGRIWEGTHKDWEWILGVNFWGVLHGVRTFVPILLEQDEEAHVVNTASIAGHMAGFGAYGVTKHAVVALSEDLHSHLAQVSEKVKVSALCPGFVRTNLAQAARNRPPELRNEAPAAPPAAGRGSSGTRLFRQAGFMEPADVAARVLDGIREERFWIFTHTDYDEVILERVQGIVARRDPGSPW